MFCFITFLLRSIFSFNSALFPPKGKRKTEIFLMISLLLCLSLFLYLSKRRSVLRNEYDSLSMRVFSFFSKIFFFVSFIPCVFSFRSETKSQNRCLISLFFSLNCVFDHTCFKSLFVSERSFLDLSFLDCSRVWSSISHIFKSAASPTCLSFSIFVDFLIFIILL